MRNTPTIINRYTRLKKYNGDLASSKDWRYYDYFETQLAATSHISFPTIYGYALASANCAGTGSATTARYQSQLIIPPFTQWLSAEVWAYGFGSIDFSSSEEVAVTEAPSRINIDNGIGITSIPKFELSKQFSTQFIREKTPYKNRLIWCGNSSYTKKYHTITLEISINDNNNGTNNLYVFSVIYKPIICLPPDRLASL